ncbi:hypothetical protein DBR06_SOUSAS15610006 [Sousa chinensis]|nr:hypothetical protein DBR06_SOUSAS15610006 [Sousa chinensis]
MLSQDPLRLLTTEHTHTYTLPGTVLESLREGGKHTLTGKQASTNCSRAFENPFVYIFEKRRKSK